MKHQWLVFLVMGAALGCGNITRECPSGLTACDNTCSDMQTDNNSCGTCGNVCSAMEQCVNGSCQCASGGKVCNGVCVDTATDAANCGDCGVACDTGEVCAGGSCGCPSGQTECDGVCVDTLTDATHCGSCTNACDTGTNCVGGACGCPSGQTDCSGTCADFLTDNSHCGDCTTACTGGQTCQSGDCACTGANTIECSDVCYDKLTSNDHCGICNNMCMGGKTCQTGSCQCTGGKVSCSDGVCYDVSADRMHCGGGCSVCTTSQLCNNGCSTAPTLSIATKWESPTGWTVPGNGPLTMTFNLSPSSTAPGITYECRTYLKSASAPAFTKCDGVNGTTTTYHPPTTGASGTYRTEVRYLQNGVPIGSPVIYEYYAHTKLNAVAKCTLPFTDAQYFTAAQNYATANPTLFPIPGTAFTSDAAFKIANPFIVVPFKQVQQSNSMAGDWGTFPRDQIVRDLSLRHSWVLGNSNRLLLMKRNFAAQGGSCQNISNMHHAGTFNFAQCEAFVMNISGKGLCIGKNTAGTAPEVKGPPYVAGWWRMRTVRYASFLNGSTQSSEYCGTTACMNAPQLIYLPP